MKNFNIGDYVILKRDIHDDGIPYHVCKIKEIKRHRDSYYEESCIITARLCDSNILYKGPKYEFIPIGGII